MVRYNREKYLKYKKKQGLLNRAQINLVLDKSIAETLQQNVKGPNRVVFEHQLKCYLLNRIQLNAPVSYDQNDILRSVQYINIFIKEFEEELKQMSETTKNLERKLQNFLFQPNQGMNNTEFVREFILGDPPNILNQHSSKSRKNKIPEKVLRLAIDLYQNLNSWSKVCNKLAEQGYLSSANTRYTPSSLSRAVSRYKSNL